MEGREKGNGGRVTLGSALDGFLKGLGLAAGLLVFFMLLSISYEVVLRYYFAQSLVWVTPFTEYSLVVLTFLGAPLLLRRNEHVSLELVVVKLNRRRRLWLELIRSIVGGTSCAIIAISGAYTTWDLIVRDVRTTEAVDIPEGLIVAVIPLTSFLMFIEFLRIIHRRYADLRDKSEQ
jgi:TRAP-type C4-dicarboxylate transport system permease small subunit